VISGKDLWPKLFLIGYVAEMITLYQIGVGKLFFEGKDQWITSWRMIQSFVWTVFFPFSLVCLRLFV